MLYLTGFVSSWRTCASSASSGRGRPGIPRSITCRGSSHHRPARPGFAQSVGLAIAERFLRHKFGPEMFDHHVFVFCGDGDLMEG